MSSASERPTVTHWRPGPIFVVAVLTVLAMLIALGTWQVQRLAWKEALLERIAERIAAPPLSLAQAEAQWAQQGEIEYVPVEVSGRFDHDGEQHFLATHQGQSGWYVYTPLELRDGRALIVNRGFIPYDRKEPATREWEEPEGIVSFTALARDPLAEKPSWIVPDNAPADNLWYWKDFAAMREAMGLAADATVPFFVDIRSYGADSGIRVPVPGVTQVDLPNNHLQYAVTWYGLAAALAVVAGFMFFRSPNRKEW
ncbi:SURF1 family protein [Pararhizobium haloflavum]|uniref:SURF1 family protein n=1 Tax=Pararhizobium haloflavum TaxID=2037914 RepID=UPI001FE008BE|nr:SURF1 family protein [Pararhizobium haloflavum]